MNIIWFGVVRTVTAVDEFAAVLFPLLLLANKLFKSAFELLLLLVGVEGVDELGVRLIVPLLFTGIVFMVSLGDEFVFVSRLRLDVLITVALVIGDDVVLVFFGVDVLLFIRRFRAGFLLAPVVEDIWVTVDVSVLIGVRDV